MHSSGAAQGTHEQSRAKTESSQDTLSPLILGVLWCQQGGRTVLAGRAGLPQCPVQKLAVQREGRAPGQEGAGLRAPRCRQRLRLPLWDHSRGCTLLSPQVLKSLNKTYQKLKRRPVTVDLDPKAVTCDELFGIIHPATREWKDGETPAL